MGLGTEPGGVAHVACRTPLVVLAQVETSDEVARLRARSLADHPRSLFIGVLCADHPDAIGDFVYTVPRLDEAIDYALGVLAAPRRQGWEANASWLPGPQLPSSGPTATSNDPARHRPQTDRGIVSRPT